MGRVGAGSSVRFYHFLYLQESDLRYLIESIWNTQSALSAHNDLYDLLFIRWNKHEEWSPWNCILLTKEEASAHEKLENVTEVCFKGGNYGHIRCWKAFL